MSKPTKKKVVKKSGKKTTKKVAVPKPEVAETVQAPVQIIVDEVVSLDTAIAEQLASQSDDGPQLPAVEQIEFTPRATGRKTLATLGLIGIAAILALALLAALSGCAAVPKNVAQRRVLAGDLRSCLSSYVVQRSLVLKKNCLDEARAQCLAAGLEPSCASDDLFTNPL